MSALSRLSPELRQKIADYFSNKDSLGFKSLKPTPIQEKAIPHILDGDNCILSAQTAGGKTEAAFWPLMDLIREHKEKNALNSVSCVYLSPLTALLNNIHPRIEDYTNFISGNAFKWHGGTSYNSRKKAIKEPPDVLLTTPESLEVILDSDSYPDKVFLESLNFVVIDEVHYFVDSERGAQLVSLLERISEICNNDLQRIGLSATVGNAQEVLSWFSGSSERRQTVVSVDEQEEKQKSLLLEYYLEEGEESDQINNRAYQHITKGGLKKSIIFTKSRQKAEDIGQNLSKLLNADKLEDRLHVHHGSVSQNLREEAERLISLQTQKGKRCIISTSTLELGIDIGGLETVIQIDEFSSVSSYLQRLGRTGREENLTRNLLCLTSKQFDFLKNLAILELGEEKQVESYWPTTENYSLLFQQLLGSIISHNGIHFDRFWSTASPAFPFRDISKKAALKIVNHGIDQGYFTKADNLLLVGDEGENEFSKRNWLQVYSTFETPPAVRVVKNNQEIGTLDAWWVYNKKLPYVFVLGGKKLKAVELDEDHGVLYAQDAPAAMAPAWASAGALTEKLVAQQMRRILIHSEIPPYISHHPASIRCLKSLKDAVNPELLQFEGLGFEYVDSNSSLAWLHTFAGDRMNYTLSLLLSVLPDIKISNVNALSFTIESKEYGEKELVDIIEKTLLNFATEQLFDLGRPEKTFGNMDFDTDSLTKFSKYLPKELSLKQFLNTRFDFRGLQKWILDIRNKSDRKLINNTNSSGLPKLLEGSLGI